MISTTPIKKPIFRYKSEYTAIATCDTQDALHKWIEEYGKKPPFDHVIFKRGDGDPNTCRVTVRLKYQQDEKIFSILERAGIVCIGTPHS